MLQVLAKMRRNNSYRSVQLTFQHCRPLVERKFPFHLRRNLRLAISRSLLPQQLQACCEPGGRRTVPVIDPVCARSQLMEMRLTRHCPGQALDQAKKYIRYIYPYVTCPTSFGRAGTESSWFCDHCRTAVFNCV